MLRFLSCPPKTHARGVGAKVDAPLSSSVVRRPVSNRSGSTRRRRRRRRRSRGRRRRRRLVDQALHALAEEAAIDGVEEALAKCCRTVNCRLATVACEDVAIRRLRRPTHPHLACILPHQHTQTQTDRHTHTHPMGSVGQQRWRREPPGESRVGWWSVTV